jgi:hypothetical protein
MENEQEVVKIILTVDLNWKTRLDDLAKRRNQSKAEVFRDAMNLLLKATDECEKGNGILFTPMNDLNS